MGSQKHQGRYQGQRPAWLLPSLLLLLLNGFLHGVVATAPGQSPGGLQSSHNEDSLTMASSHVAAPPSKAEANPVAESSAEDRAKPQQTVKRTAQQGTAVNPIILHLALQEGKESVSQPQAAATWAEPAGLQEERLQEEIGDGLYYRGLRALLGRQEKVPPAKQPQQQPCPSPDLPLGGDLLAQAAAMGHPDAQSTVALLHSEGLLTAASRRPMLLGERDEAAASAFHHFAMLGGSQASKVALAYAAFQGGSTMCDRGALLYAQAAQSAVASINDYHKHDGNRLVESVRLSAGPLGYSRCTRCAIPQLIVFVTTPNPPSQRREQKKYHTAKTAKHENAPCPTLFSPCAIRRRTFLRCESGGSDGQRVWRGGGRHHPVHKAGGGAGACAEPEDNGEPALLGRPGSAEERRPGP